MEIIYYRGQANNFSGNIKNGSDIIPSILRNEIESFNLVKEANYYKKSAQDTEESLKTYIGSDDEITTKTIGILQHQGFLTRFIDITKSYDVALYFASNDFFNHNGYVYKIIPDKSIKPLKGSLAKSITRKIYTIMNSKKLLENNTSLIDHFKIVENTNSNIDIQTIEDAVILDYDSLLSNKTLENLRMSRQKGSFILLGNEVVDNKLTGKINTSIFAYLDDPTTIIASDKLDNLYNLSIKGINYINLFPDADVSKTLISKYNEIVEFKKTNELKKLITNRFKLNSLNDDELEFKKFGEYLLNNIISLTEEFTRNKNSFYFVFKELVDYYRYYLNYLREPNKNNDFIVLNYEEIIENIFKKLEKIKKPA